MVVEVFLDALFDRGQVGTWATQCAQCGQVEAVRARGATHISAAFWVLDGYFWRCCHTRPLGRIFLCM